MPRQLRRHPLVMEGLGGSSREKPARGVVNEERIMPRVHLFAWVFAGAVGAQIGLAQPGLAFECPEPQAQRVPGVIPESPQEITELSALLRAGDLENQIEVIVHDLKQKYAKADKTELINYMMTAYCPMIAADQDLSDSEKREHMDQFGEQVWNIYTKQGL
jgi:hypothetical protein